MDPKVQAFIEAGKKAEKEQELLDEQAKKYGQAETLISLGIFSLGKVEYTDECLDENDKWDEKKGKWIHQEKIVPDVTDEEYEEILKYAKIQDKDDIVNNAKLGIDDVKTNKNAENYLSALSVSSLILAIAVDIVGIVLALSQSSWTIFVVAIGISSIYYFGWAILKVLCNISNNLHSINGKIK